MNDSPPPLDQRGQRIADRLRPRRALRACCAAVLAMLVAFTPARAQEVDVLLTEKECQVKYALLYSFGLLTTWPKEAFDPPDDGPFIIGVLGDKPYPEYLGRIAQSKRIHMRQIVIRRFKSPDELRRCHLLYVTSAIAPEVEDAVVRKLAKEPVLVVSERAAGTGATDATIQFVIEQGTVKFLLNADAAKALKLEIDPRLLKLAKHTNSDTYRAKPHDP